jgi:hypothetical protein
VLLVLICAEDMKTGAGDPAPSLSLGLCIGNVNVHGVVYLGLGERMGTQRGSIVSRVLLQFESIKKEQIVVQEISLRLAVLSWSVSCRSASTRWWVSMVTIAPAAVIPARPSEGFTTLAGNKMLSIHVYFSEQASCSGYKFRC